MPVPRQAVWTAPLTWTDSQALDEDTLNEQIRNNMLFLKSGHLSIATFYPEDGWSTPAYTTTAAAGWTAPDAALLKVSITVETTCNLILGGLLPYEHSVGTALTQFDFHDGSVYLSNGMTTPAPGGGLLRLRNVVADYTRKLSFMRVIGNKAPGTYTYTLRWSTTADTARLRLEQYPGQLWLLGL